MAALSKVNGGGLNHQSDVADPETEVFAANSVGIRILERAGVGNKSKFPFWKITDIPDTLVVRALSNAVLSPMLNYSAFGANNAFFNLFAGDLRVSLSTL